MIRTLAEHIFRPLRFQRRLPKEFGGKQMWVTPACGLRYLFRPMSQVDPILLSFIRQYVRQGDVVWDIGANLGYFSFAAAHKASRVVAVEPDIDTLRLLRRTPGIDILEAAVSSSIGTSQFCIANRSRATNFLIGFDWSTQHGGVRATREVRTVTLDWMAERYPLPDVIKIDVEGAEFEVLRGGTFIPEKRPIMLCEVSSEVEPEVTHLLKSWNYSIVDGTTGTPSERAVWDTIALP